ncbi:MAG: creatininase family protein [Polyangiaceae bacterium]|nr:creatininase family protein [Polyangiaceae bacterium]
MAAISPPRPPSLREGGERDVSIGTLTTKDFAALAEGEKPFVILLPVGSVEPHGPHLPLETDTIISFAASRRAVDLLAEAGIEARIAPAVPYGVTDFASGFAGAVSVPAATLTAFVAAVAKAYLEAGARHVCLVNNHLEPAHDAAVRAATEGFAAGSASVACPLTRRWARTLSAEFKSGACHAGQYESSLVLAARPELVREAVRETLPEVAVSLSEGIRAGKSTFAEMGMASAYAGTPAKASDVEGREQLELLAEMIAGEVTEALGVARVG